MIGARLQGRMPPNAKAANNDNTNANAKPSATATEWGKPSDFMAFSPQPGRIGECVLIDFGGIVI
jgi:hypothetical protein